MIYLAVGIAAQFLVAGIIDGGCYLFSLCYREMGMKLPDFTLFIIHIRHWAFAWPVVVLLLTAIVFYSGRTERSLLHFFGGTMLAAIGIMFLVCLAFILPFIADTCSLA